MTYICSRKVWGTQGLFWHEGTRPAWRPGPVAQLSKGHLCTSLASRTWYQAACMGTLWKEPLDAVSHPALAFSVLSLTAPPVLSRRATGGAEKAGFRPTCALQGAPLSARSQPICPSPWAAEWVLLGNKGGLSLLHTPIPRLPACVGVWLCHRRHRRGPSHSVRSYAPPGRALPAECLLSSPSPHQQCLPSQAFYPERSLGSLGSCSVHCNQLRVTGVHYS